MKLKDNYDYLYLKERMQSKFDDKDYLPSSIKDSIKAILKRCEDQEKEIEELKNPKDNIQVVCCNRCYGKTYNITKEYISKDKLREKITELWEELN